ncbi:MAG: hypothetical protein QOF79_271 [Actinomycetota bacterium]|nr:hypothetical protein [Actinomycetota bacterium]
MSKSPNRLLGVVFGVFYLLVGVLGFFVSNGGSFFATSGGKIVDLFQVNTFHNVVHLAIGAVLLIAGLIGARAARGANITVGALFLLVGIAGLFLVNTSANILAINAADNVLHFGSAVVLLAVGLGADKQLSRVATA